MFDPANATATMTASTRVLTGTVSAMGFPLLPLVEGNERWIDR
jgi:hypothetical protein